MTLLEKALYLSNVVHKNQVDKNGVRYDLHPLRVANQLSNPMDKIIALLHDILEEEKNSKVVVGILLTEFPSQVLENVRLLTHNKNESLESYAKRLNTSERAIRVKRAEIADNLNKKRLSTLKTEVRERLLKKYMKMLNLLGGELI